MEPNIKNDADLDEIIRQLQPFLSRRHKAAEENREDDFPLEESLRVARAFREWIGSEPDRFDQVQERLQFECDPMEWLLSDLLWKLKQAGMIDEMIAHAHSFAEVTNPDNFLGDLALFLAEVGRLDEALDQARANLDRFPDDAWTVIRAGEIHQIRGEFEQAESVYRKALAMADKDYGTRAGVLERLVPLLNELGRPDEAAALEREDRQRREVAEMSNRVLPRFRPQSPPLADVQTGRHAVPKPGRNSPCPCGSGKKYKRCCGP